MRGWEGKNEWIWDYNEMRERSGEIEIEKKH